MNVGDVGLFDELGRLQMDENEAYEKIDAEISNGQLVRSIWTRVYADADGDEAKAKARYIKERFNQIMKLEKSNESSIIDSVKLQFQIYDDTLTAENKKYLESLRTEIEESFDKVQKNLKYILAGTGLSKDGAQKIAQLQEVALRKLKEAVEQAPQNLSRDADQEIFIEISTSAQYYLLLDIFRHRTSGFSFGKQRDAGKKHDDFMDRLAFSAAIYLKIAENWLNFGR